MSFYSLAIDLIAADNLDYKAIAIELGKTRPSQFTKFADRRPRTGVTPYEEVIKAITFGNVDYRMLVTKLAIAHPALFVKIVKTLDKSQVKEVDTILNKLAIKQIQDAIKDNKIVFAIKLLRENSVNCINPYGLSLAESRSIILVVSNRETLNLSSELMTFVNELKA